MVNINLSQKEKYQANQINCCSLDSFKTEYSPNSFYLQHILRQLVGELYNQSLYSIGNSTQYSVMTYMGKESKKEWRYLYIIYVIYYIYV